MLMMMMMMSRLLSTAFLDLLSAATAPCKPSPRRHLCSSSGYVKRMKELQFLKGNDEECSARVRSGKFLCFHKQKPLLKKQGADPLAKVQWVTYDATHHAYSKMKMSLVVENQAALLNIDQDGIAEFALQLQGLDDGKLHYLEKVFDGTFENVRYAFTMISAEDYSVLSKASSLLKWNHKYLFCPFCGAKNVRNNAGSQRVCSTCNTVHYPQVSPSIIVVVVDHDRCLLVRQPKHPPGLYTAIAGFSEIGESFEETVRREVAEEVGLDVQNIEYLKSQHWPLPSSSLMIGCLAEVASNQKLQIDKQELEDAQWFPANVVHKAAEKVRQDPSAIFTDTGSLLIPPPGPIAFNLITTWLHKIKHQ